MCTSGCRTQDHESYAACLRDKGVRVPQIPVEALSVQKKADKNLDAYANARKFGIQPKSTRANDVQAAVALSEHTGTAFQAD